MRPAAANGTVLAGGAAAEPARNPPLPTGLGSTKVCAVGARAGAAAPPEDGKTFSESMITGLTGS